MIRQLKIQAKSLVSELEKKLEAQLAKKGIALRPASITHLGSRAPRPLQNLVLEVAEKVRDPFLFHFSVKVEEIKENSVLISAKSSNIDSGVCISIGEKAMGILFDKHLPPGQSNRTIETISFENIGLNRFNLENQILFFLEWSPNDIELTVQNLFDGQDQKVEMILVIMDAKGIHVARVFYSVLLRFKALLA